MKYILIILTLIPLGLHAQPNCNVFLYQGDTLKYEACMKVEEAKGHYQFSKEYQEAFDAALEIDPTFAYPYRAKSVAYLKSGDFITWMQLMSKAVEFDPKGNLDYRGWCRYQFFNDYEGAIKDIEEYHRLTNDLEAESANGHYNLRVTRALCYKALGQKDKALSILEETLNDPNHYVGLFDYLQFGVMRMEADQLDSAVEAFLKQQEINDLAENRYYLGLIYRAIGKKVECRSELEMAKKLYLKRTSLFDPYTEHMHKIYLEDIERELAN